MKNQELLFRQAFLTSDYYAYASKELEECLREDRRYPYRKYLWTLCQLRLGYTAGQDIAELELLLPSMIQGYVDALKQKVKVDPDDYLIVPEDETNESYLVISLCILFNQDDLLDDFCSGILDYPSLVLDSYLKLVWPDGAFVDETEPLPRGFAFRKNLKKAIDANNKRDSLKYLKAYLSGWYGNLRKLGNLDIDSHLEQDDAPRNTNIPYMGYWCFEAAAVAYLKNIDDTKLHEFIYYPKDIVQYARRKYLLFLKEDGSAVFGLSSVTGGEAATKTGNWICPNMMDQSHSVHYFNQGDILPAGTSAKGRYIWYYSEQNKD